jgi:hypothetical protein
MKLQHNFIDAQNVGTPGETIPKIQNILQGRKLMKNFPLLVSSQT